MVYRKFEITGDEFKEKLERLVEQEKIEKMYPLVEEKNFTPRTSVYKSGFYTIEVCQIEGDKREVVISRYNHSEKTIEEKIQELEEWAGFKLGEPIKD
ncbi:MAG: hypothetical protein ACP5NZ_00780 [Nanobdellota archaeon]